MTEHSFLGPPVRTRFGKRLAAAGRQRQRQVVSGRLNLHVEGTFHFWL